MLPRLVSLSNLFLTSDLSHSADDDRNFDNYVIPLAKKLKECGIFGVSSDEYLNYAMKNREEYARRGKEIVKEFKAEAELQF